MPAPSLTPLNRVYPLGDSIRAIALITVLGAHVSPAALPHFWWAKITWNAGLIGIAAFFMVSACLLYRPYVVARLAGRPQPSTRRFFRRRALRILPAYWVTITLLAIWPGLPGVFSGDWWRYYGLLQIYWSHTATGGLVVAWTLCIEVSFYLLLPLYAAAMARFAGADRGRRWLTRELSVLAALALAAIVVEWAVWYGHAPGWIGRTLVTEFQYFALGMALAVISVEVAIVRPRPRIIVDRFPGVFYALAFAVLLVVVYAVPASNPNVPALGLTSVPVGFLHAEADYWLFGVIGVLILVPVLFGDQRRGFSRRVLSARPVLALGAISYGMYLWHVPILEQLVPHIGGTPSRWILGTPVTTLFIATLVLAAAAAAITYWMIERPLHKPPTARDASPAPPAPERVVIYESAASTSRV
jgi:peptidoglycan/LPS O-acetylase OafA/YrhL